MNRMSPAPRPEWKNNPQQGPRQGLKLRWAQLRCIRLALGHYENFLVLGPLTSPHLIPHLSALYAFSRHADDLADEIPDPSLAAEKLDAWGEELRRSLGGESHHPITRALASTIRRFELSTDPLFDLLSAFRQDLTVHRFTTFDDLRDYTRRSAEPVGRLVLRLYGFQDPELDALSDSICTGLQLANFCQDVGGDARRDRIYIPLRECNQFDVDPVEILDLRSSPRLEKLLRFQIIRAYKYLRAGLPLCERLKGRFKISVRLFVLGGMQILDLLERDPLAALRLHVRLKPSQKLRALLSSLKPLDN